MKIAMKFGVRINELAFMNNINPDNIFPGEVSEIIAKSVDSKSSIERV